MPLAQIILACWITPSFDVAKAVEVQHVQALITESCLDCHSGTEPEAGFSIDSDFLDSAANKSNHSDWDTTDWEKILRRLRAGQMPPPDAAQPAQENRERAIAELEALLDLQSKRFPKPGHTDPIRRLTRTEYQNAIRDLLAIQIDAAQWLPADPLSHGFDNVTLSELSPTLLSRYVRAAETISRLAVGGPRRGPGGVTVRVPADRDQEKHVAGLPLGTRGGVVFQHHFPADGIYEVQLRLARDRDENIEGLREPHDIDVLLDRRLMHRFSVAPPRKKSGWAKDDTMVDANLKKRIQISAGPHKVGVTFPQKFASLSENRRQPFDTNHNRHRHPRLTPAIFEVSIVGPFESQGRGQTPSRKRLFSPLDSVDPTNTNPETQARQVLAPLLRLAYRREVIESDYAVPLRFFRQRYAADGFEPAIESALAAILVNPHFLFRTEREPARSERTESNELNQKNWYRISDIELATRLSFFLWSSIPDEPLLQLATDNKLREPAVLREQVARMLNDPRSDSLVTNFASQWLHLRNLDSFQPDARLFADFDDNLRLAMRGETESLVRNVLQNDLSVLDLITSDHAFLNERLAKHYGVPGVQGSHFRAVDAKRFDRGGLLRQASILAVTSYATRTSPTIRGNWILENLLGTPAPPPPPNVPSLAEKQRERPTTVRERLAVHRENPACASCHNLMDPVGFALENYDSVGRFRYFDGEAKVDSSGSLPDGTSIDSVGSLEAGIMKRPEMFVGTVAEKLLTFALGRGIRPQDGPAIRKIIRESADDDFRFSSIIKSIAVSEPFRFRMAGPTASGHSEH